MSEPHGHGLVVFISIMVYVTLLVQVTNNV